LERFGKATLTAEILEKNWVYVLPHLWGGFTYFVDRKVILDHPL
jgi:hypothetical protein